MNVQNTKKIQKQTVVGER